MKWKQRWCIAGSRSCTSHFHLGAAHSNHLVIYWCPQRSTVNIKPKVPLRFGRTTLRGRKLCEEAAEGGKAAGRWHDVALLTHSELEVFALFPANKIHPLVCKCCNCVWNSCFGFPLGSKFFHLPPRLRAFLTTLVCLPLAADYGISWCFRPHSVLYCTNRLFEFSALLTGWDPANSHFFTFSLTAAAAASLAPSNTSTWITLNGSRRLLGLGRAI